MSSSDSFGVGSVDSSWSSLDESDGVGHDPHNSIYNYFEK